MVLGLESSLTVAELAHHLKLPSAKLRRWLRLYWRTQVAEDQPIEKNSQTVSSLTLLELLAFFALRQRGVSAQKITTAHQILGWIYRTKHPFVDLTLYTDGDAIYVQTDQGEIVRADRGLQLCLSSWITPFCEKVSPTDISLGNENPQA